MKIQIITLKSWNLNNAEILKNIYQEHIIGISSVLDETEINNFKPDYIFFPHWSDKIPETIHQRYECIVFHSTDLPFGRGGTPIQNLIKLKKYDTQITAIKVTNEIDAGDVYLKSPINIRDGSVETILKNMSNIIFEIMIPFIIKERPTPKPQTGTATKFKRLTKEKSNMMYADIDLYDHIRMLDGEGYPPAFIILGNKKIEFTNVQKIGSQLKGDFKIETI